MVLVIAIDEVLEDGTALEDAEGLAVGELVSQGGNATVGVDLEEPAVQQLEILFVRG